LPGSTSEIEKSKAWRGGTREAYISSGESCRRARGRCASCVAGSAGGLGWYINNARYFLNTSTIFAGLVVISVLGILVEAIFGIVERHTVVKWGMKRAG